MTIQFLRSAVVLALPVLLAACGAGNPNETELRTAATIETRLQAGDTVASADAPVTIPATAAAPVASANMPQPDCIADGCKGLRIIDGNAEAFRYAALRRDDMPQS